MLDYSLIKTSIQISYQVVWRRVGLARALANDPEILLMDEAFSALDPLIRKEMQDELLDLQQTLKKQFYLSHMI